MKFTLNTPFIFSLLASNLTTGLSATCGPDSEGKFVVPGLFYPNKKVTCVQAKEYTRWRCEHSKFQEECPTTCCDYISDNCEDGDTRVYIEGSHKPDKKRGCDWAARKNTARRCSFPVIQDLCPHTCGLCPVGPYAFTSTTELGNAISAYCSNEADWINHPEYDTYGAIETWDVSQITDMDSLFSPGSDDDFSSYYTYYVNDGSCNPDISSWDVSNVKDFGYMFAYATSFNVDLSNWDVSSGTNFTRMFSEATSFNGDLSSWDVTNAKGFYGMFRDATSFNGDLSSWDVSSVTDFGMMFAYATSFNGDLSSWDVTSTHGFFKMFYSATSFNVDLSSWDVSSATDFDRMFGGATSFNQNICSWEDTFPSYLVYNDICLNTITCVWPNCDP